MDITAADARLAYVNSNIVGVAELGNRTILEGDVFYSAKDE